MVRKPGKLQRNWQRRQDGGWTGLSRDIDPAQSFVLPSNAMVEWLHACILLAELLIYAKYLLSVQGHGWKKQTKTRTIKFAGLPNHYPLLTMFEMLAWKQNFICLEDNSNNLSLWTSVLGSKYIVFLVCDKTCVFTVHDTYIILF